MIITVYYVLDRLNFSKFQDQFARSMGHDPWVSTYQYQFRSMWKTISESHLSYFLWLYTGPRGNVKWVFTYQDHYRAIKWPCQVNIVADSVFRQAGAFQILLSALLFLFYISDECLPINIMLGSCPDYIIAISISWTPRAFNISRSILLGQFFVI